MTIHAVEAEQIITAAARLLVLSALADSKRDSDAMLHCAAEFSAILGLDTDRVKQRAVEILAEAKRQAEGQQTADADQWKAAAAYN
jgi:hypothetical protein